ncbi:MAG: hypothetical protein QXP52_01950 [Candidatus Aenigmatarchaeota archaeon]
MNLRKISFYIIAFVMIWAPLQDTILSLIFRFYQSDNLKLLLILKETLIIIALLLLIINKILVGKIPFSRLEIFAFLFLLISTLHLLFVRPEGVPLITTFTTFRAIILPILFVHVGKFLNCSIKEFKNLTKIVFIISVFSVIFGIIEMLIPTDLFWNGPFLNLHGFLTRIKGLQEYSGGFVKGVPANFWGFIGLRRMAGFHASPLGISYYLITPIVLLATNLNKMNKKILFLFLVFGLLLTETRAAILVTFISLFIYFVDFRQLLSNMKVNKQFLFLFIFFMFLFLVLLTISEEIQNFIMFSLTGKEGRILGHIRSVTLGMKHSSETLIVGKGFGTAGSWAALQGSKVGYGGESAYIQIFIPTGGLNFFIFLCWWISIYLYLKNKTKIFSTNLEMFKLYKAFLSLQIAFFLTGFMSEQIQAFTATHNFWILTGVVLGLKNSSEELKRIKII